MLSIKIHQDYSDSRGTIAAKNIEYAPEITIGKATVGGGILYSNIYINILITTITKEIKSWLLNNN